MANYFLFLDELKANNEYTHFCIGGCFVEELYYRSTLLKKVNKLKSDIFGNTSVVLHETDVRGHRGQFKGLKNETKEQQFWYNMKEVFKDTNIHTICSGIHKSNLSKYYPSKNEQDSEYYITLQIVIENFVHFLIENDSVGCVYFESRDIYSDYELARHYNMIIENGTLFIDSNIMKKHLKCISFPLKTDNNIGLQLADFVLNPVARSFQETEQRQLNIFTEVQERAYNGNIDRNDRFGLKKLL